MRRIEIEAEARRRDRLEHLVPDRRRPGQVRAAWPFVIGEDHRAVLDRDLHASFLSVGNKSGPDFPKAAHVVGRRPRRIVADERPDNVDAELLRCVDDLPEVGVHLITVRGIGMEVVGVVRECRDLERVLREQPADRLGVERVDIDMGHARVPSALASCCGPTRDLERVESLRGSPGGNLLERQVGKRRGQESELHVRHGPSHMAAAVAVARPGLP